MAIGRYQIQLGAEQLMSGMSSSDFATDGALGVSSTGLNPFMTPGLMSGMPTPIDLSTNIVGNIIASAEDSQGVAAYNRTFVDGSGNYYTYAAPNTIVKTNTATTNAANYLQGVTDMVTFAGNTYVTTSNGDIDLWNTSGTPALTNSWWIGTKSQSTLNPPSGATTPHPMLVYNGVLYIAAGSKIHGVNSSGTIDSFFPALPFILPTSELIYALGIDPITGLMMISVQTTVNPGDSFTSNFFVYLWDGISAQPTRKIPTDDLITAFHNVEGAVYVGQGTSLGEWNGNGVTFLRKLLFAATGGADLIYKHRMCSTGRILHVVDGQNVLSYGSVVTGKKGFFYTSFNPSGTGHLSAIFPMGSIYNLGIAYATNKLGISSFMDSLNVVSTNLYFNNIYFPRPIFVRRMRIITSGIVHTGNTDMSIFINSEKGVALPISDANRFISVPTGTTYVLDFDFSQAKCQAIQPVISISNNNYGIVRVIIYYDIAE